MDSYVNGVIQETIFKLEDMISQLKELDEDTITRTEINSFIKTLNDRIWFFKQARKSID